MKWKYNGQEISSLNQDVAYVVYLITYTDNTKYVGMKAVWTQRRVKPLKGMRVNAKRMVLKESNWKTYNGSSVNNEGKKAVSKDILHLCSNRRTATYLEAKELFSRSAIENDEYNNQNILGKFFISVLDGKLYKKEGDSKWQL